MKKFLIVFGIIFILLIAIAGYIYYVVKVPISESNQISTFSIVEGQSTDEIAKELVNKKLIRSSSIFSAYIFLINKNILPGTYYLAPNMNFDEIAEIFSDGKVDENKIILLEGWSAKDIDVYLTQKGIINANEFYDKTKEIEGYLFPDTYQIALDASVEDIIKKLTDNFKDKTKNLSLTKEKLILASIVEKEAKLDDDRAKISGVYQNRLDNSMKLDADPTIQYAKGSWDPITQADYYSIDSPYNTYLYSGLPPGPISNPGIASIRAAISPVKHNYFYFFHLKDGTTIYSETLSEHEANLEKYADKL